jgi:L-2-hydroxyglutarate oxidase LhgO
MVVTQNSEIDSVDAIVIGAGVVGLAVARALALQGREVMVLEAANAIGTGISARNSEVIHSGMYYPTGSLKASLCVQGRAQVVAYCQERGIGHRLCGKLIVATEPSQIPKLKAIQAQALANGVADVRWLSAQEAMAMEGALKCVSALLSPGTGIVDSHGLMLSFQGDIENAGGMVVLNAAVEAVKLDTNVSSSPRHRVHMADGSVLATRTLINAAGLIAPALAHQFSGLAPPHIPTAYYAKGNYFTLSSAAPFRHLIYPVPESAGLGVHLTLDLGGQAKFGPDVQWVDTPDDFQVDASRADAFYAAVRTYWPALPDGALQSGYAGIRPKISGPNAPAADFLIQGPATHGVAGLVNLFGIESPGLTSSMAIADWVTRLLSQPLSPQL